MKNEAYKKKWPRKNLGELINFLESIYPEGISLRTLKEEMGATEGSWSNIFNRDDLKLSKAESIAAHFGYRLTLLFPVRQFQNNYRPPVRIKPFDNTGNLTGMYLWIRDSGMSVSQVASKLGITSNVINRALSTGDIQISTLYMFTDTFGITAQWRFEKETNN